MNDIAINAVAFVIVLGFLIFFHEAGHFMFAKLFRVKVLVFSFGFGKRLLWFQKGDTEYRVSLIPLGGYVRMAGDNPEENRQGNPEEFLSKPKWQRFIILVAGPVMNVIIAIAFVAALAMIGREEFIVRPIIGEVLPDQPAARAGLREGDLVISVKGEPMKEFDDVRMLIAMNAGTPMPVVYERAGVRHTTTLTPKTEEGDFGPIGRAGMYPGFDPIVGRVVPGSPAQAAGVRVGDILVSANGKPVRGLDGFGTVSEKLKTKAIPIEVLRGTQRVALTLPPSTKDDNSVRGIQPPIRTFKLTFFPALRYSVQENWKMLRLTGAAVRRLFRPEGSVKELSGPINIARISGKTLRDGGVLGMLALMAMISLQLGIMNLLPIPVLDGGHIMILLIEGIARRDLSLRVKERIQQAGFAVLATLMLVVLYNDVISNVMRFKNG